MSFTGNKLLTASNASTRPLNWNTSSSLFGTKFTSVAYGEGVFVAVHNGASGYQNSIAYSTDGITWQVAASSLGEYDCVTYGNGRFVTVDGEGTGKILYSDDGINWVAPFSDTSIPGNIRTITYGEGIYLCAGTFNGSAAYSTNGINWTSSNVVDRGFVSLTYGNGRFVGISYDAGTGSSKNGTPTNLGAYSDGGTSGWTVTTLPVTANWYKIAFGNNRFVAFSYAPSFGGAATTIYSNDGINWQLGGTLPASTQGGRWSALTYGNGRFVAVKSTNSSHTDPNYAYSTDGINWITGTIPLRESYVGAAYGNGRFVAVADAGSSTPVNLFSYTT